MKSTIWQLLCKQGVLFLFAAGAAASARSEIRLGQIAPMNNPVAVEGRDTNFGIKVAIDSVNAQGGIAGQKIVLRTEDDEFNPKKAEDLVREFAKSDILALMQVVGSPTMAKILQDKVPETTGLPIIGVIPGSEALRKPINPYVFHIRASDIEQYHGLIRNALTIGLNKIAVVYLDTPPVKAGVAAMESMLSDAKLVPVARIPFVPKPNLDHSEAMKVLRAANPNLIVLALPGQIAGEFVRAYREQGMGAQITSLSYGVTDTVCRVATPALARGVSVVQVLPNIRNTALPLVRQFQDDFRNYGPKNVKPTTIQFEGYVTARVLMEAIRRTGAAPTRERLIKALNGMQKVNLGGFEIDFSPTKHVGSDYVELSVITKDCAVVY